MMHTFVKYFVSVFGIQLTEQEGQRCLVLHTNRTMHVVAGGHHWMMLEQPDTLATQMEQFFLERVRD